MSTVQGHLVRNTKVLSQHGVSYFGEGALYTKSSTMEMQTTAMNNPIVDAYSEGCCTRKLEGVHAPVSNPMTYNVFSEGPLREQKTAIQRN